MVALYWDIGAERKFIQLQANSKDYMGSPSPQEMASQNWGAFAQYYPAIMEEMNAQAAPAAKAQLGAAQAVTPGYAQLTTDTLNKYGGDLVNLANKYQASVDPEFYGQRAAVADANSKLLGSMDPTQLSGSERAEVTRGLGQMGFQNPGSNLDAVNNAMTFGSKLQQKQQMYGGLTNQIAGTMPNLKSGLSGIGIASGNTSMGLNAPGAGTAASTGNNYMGQLNNLATTYMNNQPNWAQGTQAIGSVLGGIGSIGTGGGSGGMKLWGS